jgi:hypothetical protein
MSLAACIPELLAQRKIRKPDAEKASRAYKRHYEALRGTMGDEAAAAEATERALGELDYAAKLRKRQAGLAILAQQAMDRDMAAAAARGVGPHRSLVEMLRQVEIATERLTNQAHETMLGFIERHRRNLLGRPHDKTGLIDVVDELHGKDSGNSTAKEFSDAIGDVFERLRLRFNRNGGDIGHRADFGLPHRYDPLKVRQASAAEFRDDFLRELAPEKMIDPLTGGSSSRPSGSTSSSRRRGSTSAPTGSMSLAAAAGSPAGARQPAQRPALLRVQGRPGVAAHPEKYGDGNPFEAVMSHVHGMARDIAFMERFGPNPAASWKRALARADGIAAASDAVHTGSINGTSAAKFHAERCGAT